MAKRTKAELDVFKGFVDRSYNRWGNMLMVNVDKPYDPQHSELGYCFKYVDPVSGRVVYKIECSKLGIERTDFRVMMHEYGHIYLAHLDGIHEELDTQICNVFQNRRGQLIDEINKSCGIDFADKLIERVIDDPVLNHSLHNIAMDMEVNSTILSKEDIEEMEMDITTVLPKTDEELVKYMIDHAQDPAKKKELEDALKKMQSEAKIKLIVPERYHLGPELDASGNPIPLVDDQGQPVVDADGNPMFKMEPFPNDLTYSEYLMLIIEHLDQFVKMLVSINMGGNGDTSQITQQDIQNALNQMAQNWANKSDEYKKGYQDALNDYKNNQLGQQQNNPQQGNQQGQPGQQGQDQSMQGGQQPGQDSGQNGGQPQPGQGQGGSQCQGQQGQPGQGSGSGNSQGQGGQSQGGQGMSDYQQGYQDALNDIANQQGQAGSGMNSLSQLMQNAGMSPQSSDSQEQDQNTNSPYKGQRSPSVDQDCGKDHRTDSRDAADKKRELGQIHSGSTTGCGASGGPDATRSVDKTVDEVDMALQEVMQNVRTRVIKVATKKDNLKLYNRGIIRSVIAPTVSRKVTISNDPKIVYLIDISGSMDTALVDRILQGIAKNMKRLSRGLRYDIISWSTRLGEHIKDIDPRKGVPRISMGGGTRMAEGIKYFKENYGPEAILIVISDFEDYLEEWHEVEKTMPGYSMYGFNYGCNSYGYSSSYDSDKIDWKYMKIRKFKQYR